MLWIAGIFVFALGACVGSFLNVVVWRLPRIDIPDDAGLLKATALSLKGLSHPPSHCPKCEHKLGKTENVPILGWLWLGGKCRHCKTPISVRYPAVELLTALVFTGLFCVIFLLPPKWGPPADARQASVVMPAGVFAPASLSQGELRDFLVDESQKQLPLHLSDAGYVVSDVELQGNPARLGLQSTTANVWLRMTATLADHWPMLAILLTLASCLIAASLIDAELFIIPRGLSYLPALVAVPLHAIYDEPFTPLSMIASPVGAAWGLGGAAGLVLSLALVRLGLLRRSFADGMPMLDHEKEAAGVEEDEPTRGWVTREMAWEILFVLPAVLLGLACAWSATGPLAEFWQGVADTRWLSAMAGSLMGGLVGAASIWAVRIGGTLLFGREAMGLGDVDLMFGVGCCLGAGPAGLALFPASIVGLLFALQGFITRRAREMPFGPYLAIASLAMIVLWNPLADYLRNPMQGLGIVLGPVAPVLGL